MGKTWQLWLIPLPLEWGLPLWLLAWHNLRPKLLNDNYPPPWAQVKPLESGALTWENFDSRSRLARSPDTGPITMPTTNHKDRVRAQHRYPQIPTPKVGREKLARWFWLIVRNKGEGFSQARALKPYGIQRKECKAIQAVFVKEGWAEDRGGTQGIWVYATGLSKMMEVVQEFCPHAPLPPDRAQGV